MSENKNTGFKIPERIVTFVDLSRVIRELKYLDDWLNQAAIRSGGQEVKAPKTSISLDEIASLNGISLLDANHRSQLIKALEVFSAKAPRIHMSFPVEPTPAFLSKMIVWLRTNINPIILMDVGLQPALAAGCSVRTSNKYFDMSLRNRFVDSRSYLVKAIEEFAKLPTNKPVQEEAVLTTKTVSPEEQQKTPDELTPKTTDSAQPSQQPITQESVASTEPVKTTEVSNG